jgi:ribosome-binding protein aMBF1 (putative translation factor)
MPLDEITIFSHSYYERIMILNERQYAITKAQIRKFELALMKVQESEIPKDLNGQLRRQNHLDALESQLEEMHEEVEEYEKLKAGKIDNLALESYSRLPEALIQARIIRGWTQEQLAERLGVKAQQVQRDEANLYAGASFSKLLEIQKALNIEVKLTVSLK